MNPSPGTQLNWLARYVPLKQHLDETARASLLEVGSGSRGLACILPSDGLASFVGIDMKFAGTPAPAMLPFSYGGGRLPFRDGAFHTVVSMDTLEHVPQPLRAAFLHELARVGSARVIAGFPTRDGGGDGQEGEKLLGTLFRALGMGDPDWLHEHEELGLPSSDEVEAVLAGLDGWSWRRLKTTGNLVNLMAVLMDVLPGAGRWVAPVLAGDSSELEAWFRAGMFGPADRAVYLLERRVPLAPVVTGVTRSLESVRRALCCPDCGGDLTAPVSPAEAAVACAGCARVFRCDAQGVMALSARPGPTTFVLSPDWLGSAHWIIPVHNFLHAFGHDEPCRLWLRADPAELTGAEALELLRPLLAPFGDRPFAEIYLSDDPQERPNGGQVIALSADKDRCREYTGAWFRGLVPQQREAVRDAV